MQERLKMINPQKVKYWQQQDLHTEVTILYSKLHCNESHDNGHDLYIVFVHVNT